MKIRRTFHIYRTTNNMMNDIYMYYMQRGKKHTYSDLLSMAIELLRDKIASEKDKK